jgi:hypothetical protein
MAFAIWLKRMNDGIMKQVPEPLDTLPFMGAHIKDHGVLFVFHEVEVNRIELIVVVTGLALQGQNAPADGMLYFCLQLLHRFFESLRGTSQT